MAQLRQEYDKFVERGVTILVIGPDNAKSFAKYFGEHDLPFLGLPDPRHSVLKRYGQEIKLGGRQLHHLAADSNLPSL